MAIHRGGIVGLLLFLMFCGAAHSQPALSTPHYSPAIDLPFDTDEFSYSPAFRASGQRPRVTANGTTIPSAQIIRDAAGTIWTLVGAQIAANGVVDPITANVVLLLYYNNTVYQQAGAAAPYGWWSWSGSTWVSLGTNGDPRAVSGVCGSSNGGTFASAPSTNLCTVGAASSVTGTGPWNWTCAGSNGGTTASCSASATASCTVTITAPNSIQSAISANPAGTSFCLAAGTWHQQQISPALGDHFIGDPNGGTILTGDDITATLYARGGDLGGILFKNITVTHYSTSSSECGTGAIHGTNNWVFDHDTFTLNNCTGLVVGPNTTVTGGHYTFNKHAGIQSGSADSSNILIQGAEIANNNTRNDNGFNDAAGIKLAPANNSTVRNNWIHDNASVGLWCDLGCVNIVFEYNTVTGNTYEGIRYEISDATSYIRHNVANNNGGAVDYPQIGVWSSDHVQVYNNNVKAVGNEDGIIIQADPRPDAPNNTTQFDVLHDNTITFTALGSPHASYGMRNYGGPLGAGGLASSTSNTNTFFVNSLADPHWVWSTSTNPISFSSYRSSFGQDAASTVSVGDGSVVGCPQMDCTGAGMP